LKHSLSAKSIQGKSKHMNIQTQIELVIIFATTAI